MADEKLNKNIQREIRNATVKILGGGEPKGTGFFITPDGYLLTAYHCIKDNPTQVAVKTCFDEEFPALLDREKSLPEGRYDIAVLKVNYQTPHYLPVGVISADNFKDAIEACGYPAIHKPQNKESGLYSGNISRFRDDNRIEIDAIKGQGQSGGPIYHYASNRVIALASAGYKLVVSQEVSKDEIVTDSGLAVRLEPLFDRWVELAKINQQVADTWEKKLRRLTSQRNRHLVFFAMLPAMDKYAPLREKLREVVEDRWGCQLFVDSDRQYGENVIDNLRAHMEQAQAFIAEVTEADPNVMFALGAVRFYLHNCPIVLLAQSQIQPPTILKGQLYLTYHATDEMGLADYLEGELLKKANIKKLLDEPGRERYLSARQLKQMSRLAFDPQIFQRLAERYPTQEAWQQVTEVQIKPLLGKDNADLAEVFLKRICSRV